MSYHSIYRSNSIAGNRYYKGSVLSILGSVEKAYFLGAAIGRLLGYIKPRNAIGKYVWNHNKIFYSELDIPAPDRVRVCLCSFFRMVSVRGGSS